MGQSVSCSKGQHGACISRRCKCMCGHPDRVLLADQATPAPEPVEPHEHADVELFMVPMDKLVLAPNIRRDVAQVDELAESIRRHGILEPLIGCPTEDGQAVEIIAGQRRYTAGKKAGLTSVPVVVRPRPSFQERLLLQLTENLERADMTPIEEAHAFAQLADAGMPQNLIARAVSRSQAHVSFRLQLLDFPQVVQDGIHERRIDPGVALSIPRELYDDSAAVKRLATALEDGADQNVALRAWAHEESRRIRASGQPVKQAYAIERPVSLPLEHCQLAKVGAEAQGIGTRAWIRAAIEEKAVREGLELPEEITLTERVERPSRERVA